MPGGETKRREKLQRRGAKRIGARNWGEGSCGVGTGVSYGERVGSRLIRTGRCSCCPEKKRRVAKP